MKVLKLGKYIVCGTTTYSASMIEPSVRSRGISQVERYISVETDKVYAIFPK